MLKKRDKKGQVRGQLKVTYNSNFEKCMFSFILSIIFGFHELYLCACTIFIKLYLLRTLHKYMYFIFLGEICDIYILVFTSVKAWKIQILTTICLLLGSVIQV